MNSFKKLLVVPFLLFAMSAQAEKEPKPDRNPNETVSNQRLPAIPAPRIWHFENGSTLAVLPDEGVDWIPASEAQLHRLVAGRVTQAPRQPQDADAPGSFPSNAFRITLVEVNNRIHVVTQEGKAIDFPFAYDKKLAFARHTPWQYWIRDVEVDGVKTQFMILSLGYAYSGEIQAMHARDEVFRGLNYGETYIIREDGAFTKLDNRFHTAGLGNEIEVIDGIVVPKGPALQRRFDLARFDEEAEFKTRPTTPVNTKEGVLDPAAFAATFTKNLSQEVISEIKDEDLAYEELTEEERDTFRRAFARDEMNSIVVLGPAGSGKTELVKRFIAQAVQGKVPGVPRSAFFIAVEAAALGSGTGYVGSIESRIEAMAKLADEVPIYLVVDEIHALAGQGTHSGNSNDIWEALKPYLSSGRVKLIGMSTQEEFDRAYSGRPALYQRFTQFKTTIPTRDQAIARFAAWVKKRGKPAPDKAVLERVYELSEEFNAIGAQPRKGILLLIDAYADLKIKGQKNRAPTVAEVEQSARRIYNLDPKYFDRSARKERLANLPGVLDADIVGHRATKDMLKGQATISLANAHDPNRPRMTALLAGPEGVGKTELVFSFGKAMGLPVKRITLSKYQGYNAATELLAEIKQALEVNAFTIFLLDEADKTTQATLEALLPVLDKGRFNMPAHMRQGVWVEGAEVSARNASFIFAGNFAAGFTQQGTSYGFTPKKNEQDNSDQALRTVLIRDGLSKFVLDRIQAVSYMDFATKEEFREVLGMHLDGIMKEQSERQRLPVTPQNREKVLDALTNKLYREGLGNRAALRLLTSDLRLVLAEALLDGDEAPREVNIGYDEQKNGLSACQAGLESK